MSRSLTRLEERKTKDTDRKSYLPKVANILRAPSYGATYTGGYYGKYRNPGASLKKRFVMNTMFDIEEKYEIIDTIGQGAYGIVVAAKDKTANKKEKAFVAIKKIEKAFEHKIFTKRTLRELKILRLLSHENIIGIRTLLLPRSREEFEDIYVASPLMETDLGSIIKSPQSLGDDHIKIFIYQILRGLKYMHSAGIIHRDLKPRNLLVNSNCDLKICDFGLSRAIHCIDRPGKMTDYVATRWYRAPELLLEIRDYGASVDVWSVGCILAELLKRKPFLPGSDTKNQLDLTFDMFGTPSEDFISTVPKQKLRHYLRSLLPKKPRSFEVMFPKANPLAIDLLRKMTNLDYRKRITVNEALSHPYLKDFHVSSDEPIRDQVPASEFEFEKYPLSLEQLKDLVYEEILLYHFEDFKKEYFSKVRAGGNPFEHITKNVDILKSRDLDDDY